MSINRKPLLLLRPPQGDGESFPGYITRLCEENRIPGAGPLARMVGLSYTELVMLDPQVFKQIINGYRSLLSIQPGQYRLLSGLTRNRLGVSTDTRICPQCFKEGKYHLMRWDWPLSVTCQIHDFCLMDYCPQCGVRISHLRCHTYLCRCGMDWRCCVTPPAPPWLSFFYHIFAPWRERETLEERELIYQEHEALRLLVVYLASLKSTKRELPRKPAGRTLGKLDLKLLDDIDALLKEWPACFQWQVIILEKLAPWPLSDMIKSGSRLGLSVLTSAAKGALKSTRHREGQKRSDCAIRQRPASVSSISNFAKPSGRARGAFSSVIASRPNLKITQAAEHLGCSPYFLNLLARAAAAPGIGFSQRSIAQLQLSDLDHLAGRLDALSVHEEKSDVTLKALCETIATYGDRCHSRRWILFLKRVMAGSIPLFRLADSPLGLSSLAVRDSDLPAPRWPKRRRLATGYRAQNKNSSMR